jgi:hypothetical protein
MLTRTFAALSAMTAAAIWCGGGAADPVVDRDKQELHAYILLDRTGSMQPLWEEALSSVNAYAAGLGAGTGGARIRARITLATFDASEGLQFDILRRAEPAERWRGVSDDDATPRGMTPLYDAIGRMTALAENDSPERAILVVMTDGEENASREVTRDGAKAALDRLRRRGWETVFLGADFADFSDAEGVGQTSSRNMGVAKGAMTQTMERLSEKSRAWASGEAASVEWTPEDRAIAGEGEVGGKAPPVTRRPRDGSR